MLYILILAFLLLLVPTSFLSAHFASLNSLLVWQGIVYWCVCLGTALLDRSEWAGRHLYAYPCLHPLEMEKKNAQQGDVAHDRDVCKEWKRHCKWKEWREWTFVGRVLVNQFLYWLTFQLVRRFFLSDENDAKFGGAPPLDWSRDCESAFVDCEPMPSVMYSLIVQNALFCGTFYLLFTILHNILHVGSLYKWHKLHHGTFADCGITAMYMSTLDCMFEVTLPMVAAFLVECFVPAFVASHVEPIMGGWITAAHVQYTGRARILGATVIAIEGVLTHAGYHFPLGPNPRRHIAHHRAGGRAYHF